MFSVEHSEFTEEHAEIFFTFYKVFFSLMCTSVLPSCIYV